MSYDTILVSRAERVGTITLESPQALNALNSDVMRELTAAAADFDADAGIGAIVITGSAKAFAAEPTSRKWPGCPSEVSSPTSSRPGASWQPSARPPSRRSRATPWAGLRARDDVRFVDRRRHRQVRPARDQARCAARHGGSQRLTRAIGKAKAMDLILTGRTIDAGRSRTQRTGVASGAAENLLDEAAAVATTISQMSRSAADGQEAVNRAFESTLTEGLLYERRLFHSAFATDDQTEGMAAFTEKRAPEFTHR